MKRDRDEPFTIDPHPFAQVRDKQMFEHDRNILARIIYKNGNQYRRHEFLTLMKKVVRLCDEFLDGSGSNKSIFPAIQKASEWWFQLLNMGHMLPQTLTVVACLGRLSALLRRLGPKNVSSTYSHDDDDEGVPIET